MPEKFKPEQREFAPKVELKITEPHNDKNFMIGFEGKTEKECQAYNWAISSVMKEAELNPFHQIGTTSSGVNEPGYHAWEVWKEITKEDLEALLPQIEQKAEKMLLG